jgi:hypothetical protein
MNMMSSTESVSHTANHISTDDVASISSAALLVQMSISNWAGRKLDRKASAEVSDANAAERGMANVNKKLLGKNEYLKAIQTHVSAARDMHTRMTMPWGKTGWQLCPTEQYFKYTETMTRMQNEFYSLVQQFLDNYEQAVEDAHVFLGELMNPDDYPSLEKLSRKFAFNLDDMPLPTSGDFRLDIGNQGLSQLANKYEKFYITQFETAMNDIWKRTYDALSKMSERLDYETETEEYVDDAGRTKRRKLGAKTFRDTLVSNVTEMVDLLKVSNVTNSPQMTAMADRLEEAMLDVTPAALRDDELLRKQTKAEVDAAIAALPTLDI